MKKSIKNYNGNLLPSVLILSGPVHTLLFPCYCAITLFFVAKCSLNSRQAYRPRKMSTLKKKRSSHVTLLTQRRNRRGRRVCSWDPHRERCGSRSPADSVDKLSAQVTSGTFPPAVRSRWWPPPEEPGRLLCGPPCEQSDWSRGPCVQASGEDNDPVVVGKCHLLGIKQNCDIDPLV